MSEDRPDRTAGAFVSATGFLTKLPIVDLPALVCFT